MKEIPLTKGFFALVDDEDYDYLMQWKWKYHKGYAGRNKRVGMVWKTIFMHRIISQAPNGFETDHINRNKLDNRRENLRICTYSQNKVNVPPKSNNKTGYKGVHRLRNRWVASMNKKHIGVFDTPEEAACAYDKKAKELHGEFAWLNSPDDVEPRQIEFESGTCTAESKG